MNEIDESIRQRLQAIGETREAERFYEESALQPPANLANIRLCDPTSAIGTSISDRFVGRSNELAKIDFVLSTMRGRREDSPGAVLRMSSAGGYGKTLVAAEYLHRYGPLRYPDGLFWIDAAVGEIGLEKQQYEILCSLNPFQSYPDIETLRQNGAQIRELPAEALRKVPRSSSILVVVDDIPETPSDEQPHSISEYCPALGTVTVLATSRQRSGEPGVIEIELETLSTAASILLLTKDLRSRSDLEDKDWASIAAWVGNLPLALDLLNRALYFNAVTPQGLLNRCRHASVSREFESLKNALEKQVAGRPLRGLVEAFFVSFELLDSDARNAATVLAEFAAVLIPETIMEAMDPNLNAPKVRAVLTGRHFVMGTGKGSFRENASGTGRLHSRNGEGVR